jgi:hypothetical protein
MAFKTQKTTNERHRSVDVAKLCSVHRSGIGTCPKVQLASFSTVCVGAATVAEFRAARVISNTEAGVACYCAARSVSRDGVVGGVLPINKYCCRGCVCEAEEEKGSSGEVDKLHNYGRIGTGFWFALRLFLAMFKIQWACCAVERV